MNTKPILFNTEMVRALLDGRKTQTRRIVKPQPKLMEPSGRWYWEKALNVNGRPFLDASRRWWEYYGTSPYGQPGDLLWVKEVCWMWGRWLKNGKTKTGHQAWRFEADQHDPRTVFDKPDWTVKRNGDVGWVYRHARFMPRKASRLTLRITNIRVERVQDISEDDALAEGIKEDHCPKCGYTFKDCVRHMDHDICVEPWPLHKYLAPGRTSFMNLWNSIHGPDAWDRNDWVWVIEFEVIKQNVDDLIAGASNYAGVE